MRCWQWNKNFNIDFCQKYDKYPRICFKNSNHLYEISSLNELNTLLVHNCYELLLELQNYKLIYKQGDIKNILKFLTKWYP